MTSGEKLLETEIALIRTEMIAVQADNRVEDTQEERNKKLEFKTSSADCKDRNHRKVKTTNYVRKHNCTVEKSYNGEYKPFIIIR